MTINPGTFIQHLRDVRRSIETDVINVAHYHSHPCRRDKSGGHFSVPRDVFCYVDHLGYLAYGNRGSTVRAVKFMKDYFPSKYKNVADTVYAMWRHGTVHQYEPKLFMVSNSPDIVIKWVSTNHNRTKERQQHLLPFRMNGKDDTVYLVVNICQLADDLLQALNDFENDLVKNTVRIGLCSQYLETIRKPEEIDHNKQKLSAQIKDLYKKRGGLLDNKGNIIKEYPINA